MLINCIVKPNSREDIFTVNNDGSLRIKIKAPAKEGKANAYLIKFLSRILGLTQSNITIISGLKSSHKKIRLTGDEKKIKSMINSG